VAGYEEMSVARGEIVADFRSDTVTRATPAMREVMASAVVGDDVYGEDPTVNELQDRVASLTGKDAALYLPSATQANLVAILCHCGRGEEYLSGANYHVFHDEAGGASALGGVVACPIPVDDEGAMTEEQIRASVKADDPHYPITRLLCLENTVSGSVQPVHRIDTLAISAHEMGLVTHLDGARLFNAAVASDVEISAFLDHIDSVTLCLSKGLGAPMGAVLAADQATIGRAIRIRKMLGGAQRQIGHVAAAGLYAMDHHVDRLSTDHARAARLSSELGSIDRVTARAATNMVFVDVPVDHREALRAHVARSGIALGGFRAEGLRIVCHLDIDTGAIDRLIEAFTSYFVGERD
jgi:threonine aldolase